MRVKFSLGIGFVGATREEIFECEDDMTEEELNEQWEEWAWNYISGGVNVLD